MRNKKFILFQFFWFHVPGLKKMIVATFCAAVAWWSVLWSHIPEAACLSQVVCVREFTIKQLPITKIFITICSLVATPADGRS